MKKNIIVCAILMLTSAFGVSAQNLDTAKADMQKMIGDWTYSIENPMDGAVVNGEVSVIKDGDTVNLSISGMGENAIKASDFKPTEDGRIQTYFYVEEYAFDVPMDLKLVDDNTIKVTIDVSGFFMEFDMKRKN